MKKIRSIKRCETCPTWIGSKKDVILCDECTRLQAMMQSLWKTPEMPELAELSRIIDAFPTSITDSQDS